MDKKRKDADELERLRKKDQLNQERLNYLNWQRNLRENSKKALTEREQLEKQMLNEEWEKEKQREQAIKRERDRILRERNLEIIQHNDLTKQLKFEEEQRERELDRQLISEIVKREANEEQQELDEKIRRRMEAKERVLGC